MAEIEARIEQFTVILVISQAEFVFLRVLNGFLGWEQRERLKQHGQQNKAILDD
jgi:hypothetical protein